MTLNSMSRSTRHDRTDQGGAIEQLIRDIESLSPVGLRLRVDTVGDPSWLTGSMVDAVRRATLEALRNVQRHSGSDQAELTVRSSPESLNMAVVDHGVGFDTTIRTSFGTNHSIKAPINGVGGEVSLEKTPGGGATVRMRLTDDAGATRVHSLTESFELVSDMASGNRSLVGAVIWPLMIPWIYLSVRYSIGAPHQLALLALALGFIAICLIIARRLTHRAPTWRWLTLVGAVMVALHLAGLLLLSPGAMLTFASWPTGFTAVPLVLLCFVLPIRPALVLIAPHPFLVLVFALASPTLAFGTIPWGSLNATLSSPLIALSLGWLLRRSGRQVRSEQARLNEASRAVQTQQALARATSLHLDHTRRLVVPWLEQIASDGTLITTPQIKKQAHLFGLEARDDLYAPGFYDDELRSAVSAYRASGGSVELRAGFRPGAARREVGDLLGRICRALPGGHKITLLPPSPGQRHARVVVVPPVEHVALQSSLRQRERVRVDSDAYRTVFEADEVTHFGE